VSRYAGFPARPILRLRALRYSQGLLGRSGIADWYANMQAEVGATILMYHSVPSHADAKHIDPRYRLTPECFAAQLDFLARFRRVIPLHQLVSYVQQGSRIEPGTVVLTFDDGYRDNFSIALPMLQERNLSATFFVSTRYIDDGRPQWIDELYSLFMSRGQHRIDLSGAGKCWWFDLSTKKATARAFAELSAVLLRLPYEARNDLLAAIAKQLRSLPPAERLTASWDDLAKAIETYPLVEIGSHGATHRDLSSCSPSEIEREVRESVHSLMSRLGVKCRFFSFPYNGVQQKAMPFLRSAGIGAVFVGHGLAVARATTGLIELPRIEAPAERGLLRLVTSGAYPKLSKRVLGRI
jgi:peptidoglycan/xylan/chitin deacetylase (PgdA/CDA1 family)